MLFLRRMRSAIIRGFSRYCPIGLLLFFWHILTLCGGRITKRALQKREEGRLPEERKVPLPGVGDAAANDRKRSYIENQAELSHIPFGTHRKSNMSYSGCEIIAVYNFLLRRGKPADLSKLIQYFELHGASLRGGFGVEPRALYHFLHCRYSSISFSCGKDAEKKLANTTPDACIITVQNDRNDIFQMLHTVCVTKEEAGYVIHNAYRRDKNGRWSASETYPTIAEAATHITGAPRVVAVVL